MGTQVVTRRAGRGDVGTKPAGRVGLDPSHWQNLVAILLFNVVAFGREVFSRTLFSDDWGNLNNAMAGTLACPNLDRSIFLRPLDTCALFFEYRIFGLNIAAYHAAKFAVDLGLALVLYWLLTQFVPRWRPFSLITTLVFLVYPTKFTGDWMIMTGGDLSFILLLLSGVFLVFYYRTQRRWELAASLASAILATEIYEATLGLIAVAAAVAGLADLRLRRDRRPASPAFVGLIGVFAAGRWLAQIGTGNAFGHPTDTMALTPRALLHQMVVGYRISFQSGWTAALRDVAPGLSALSAHQDALAGAALLVVVVVAAMIARGAAASAGKLIALRGSVDAPAPLGDAQIGGLALAGLVIVGAGYVPTVLAVAPGLDFMSSRGNILPSVGAALTLTSCLALLSRRLASGHARTSLALAVLAAPFLILGTAAQYHAFDQTQSAWAEQKRIWQQLFELAPNLRPGTTMLLVLPLDGSGEGAQIFEPGPWSFSAEISDVYGQPGLRGFFSGTQDGLLQFRDDGVLYRPYGTVVPYDQAVMFKVDPSTMKLSLVPDTPADLSAGDGKPRVFCQTCIIPEASPATEERLRFLIR